MMEYKKTDKGYTIGDKLYLGDDVQDDKITLKTKKGEIMQYGDHAGSIVEYPGEYDVNGTGIICYDAGGVLHYVIRVEDQQVAIIQDKAVFDSANFDAIDHWMVTQSDIQNEIESLELEGAVTVME